MWHCCHIFILKSIYYPIELNDLLLVVTFFPIFAESCAALLLVIDRNSIVWRKSFAVNCHME